MYRPALVTPPAILPVTLVEMKAHLGVDSADDDKQIMAEIASAVDLYEGWSGILGRCLVEQTWRQDFDRFERCLWLPLGPVISIASVKWRNEAGEIVTLAAEEYALKTDGGGRSYVRFRDAYGFPSRLYEVSAVSVEYVAGYPTVLGVSTVPADIKTAIKLRVQMIVDEAASSDAQHVVRAETSVIDKYRRTF